MYSNLKICNLSFLNFGEVSFENIKRVIRLKEKQKLVDIAEKIVSEFRNTKISFVKNEDIIKFFENKENPKASQLEFFFDEVKNNNAK